jgi:XTP/dITP diphosphohydrolase
MIPFKEYIIKDDRMNNLVILFYFFVFHILSSMKKKIIFATNNQHKLKEIQNLLGDDFLLVSLENIGFAGDIPENRDTLEGNAYEKAKFIYDRLKLPCFADDTGLEVEALDGKPGVYSARYAGSIADYGTEKLRTEANICKLLQSLNDKPNKNARFRTVIAYLDGISEYFFEGIVNGKIINEKRGADGFGYDPVFVPDGFVETFAEMPLAEKNKISHRSRAFTKFIHFLANRT